MAYNAHMELTKEMYRNLAANHPMGIRAPFDGIYEIAGFDALYAVSTLFGGLTIYVPNHKSLFSGCVCHAMRGEHNGYNTNEIAKKYGYTPRATHRIISGL